MGMTEYPTLTALMAGREPGSVKVRFPSWNASSWLRPCRHQDDGTWTTIEQNGLVHFCDDAGPWLIVSEDAPDKYRVIDGELCKIVPGAPPLLDPALDTLRLEIAARVLAGLFSTQTDSLPCALHEDHGGTWDRRHAYALAEADALIAEARK